MKKIIGVKVVIPLPLNIIIGNNALQFPFFVLTLEYRRIQSNNKKLKTTIGFGRIMIGEIFFFK
jgi:hypothetical protein